MRKLTVIFAGLLFAFAAAAQASQKIVSYESAFRGGAIVKSVESIGGQVTRQFKLIDALVAIVPDNIKDASIYSLAGVTSVEEDKYIKWIESEPLSMNAVALPRSLHRNQRTPGAKISFQLKSPGLSNAPASLLRL